MAEINLPNCNHFRLLSVSYFLLSISRHLNIYHRQTCINKFASFYHYRCYPPRCRTHRRRVPSVTFHDRCQHPMCQQGFNNYARQSQKVNKHYIHAQGTVTIMSPMSTGSKEACGQLFQLTSGRTRTRSSEEIFLQTFVRLSTRTAFHLSVDSEDFVLTHVLM